MSATTAELPAPDLLSQLIAALEDHRAGRLATAEHGYRGVLSRAPDDPTALHLLGVLTLATGRAEEAVGLLRSASVARGGNEDTRLALADALAAAGAAEEAEATYRALIADSPGNLAAMINLANLLRDTGDPVEAVVLCRKALLLAPKLVQGHVTLGSAMLAAGQVSEAIGAYRMAITLRPEFASAQIGLAMALLRAQRADAAVAASRRGVALAPALAEAWFVHGAALRAQGVPAEAAEALLRAIALDPLHVRAHLTLGNALLDMDRPRDGAVRLRQAIAIDPALPEAHASLGFMLTAAGRLSEAITACDEAIRLRPDFAIAYWNRSFVHLLAGDFAAGWADFEWRKRHDAFARDLTPLPGTEWTGEDLTGKTLLINTEQGMGDTLQFARFFSVLADRGARVVVACAKVLMPLIAGVRGVAAVVPRTMLPAYDFWINQMSVPRLLGTEVGSIPSAAGYVSAAPVWAPSPRRRVGIVLAGNPQHSNDVRRSMPDVAAAGLAALPGIEWVSLQVGSTAAAVAARFGVADLTQTLTDFGQTAAVVASLDLVISVDTAVAHLAGAMGVKVWLMLPHAPDWRWMLERDDTPWYASMRLFRQAAPGDWASVTGAVAAALCRDG